MLKRERGLVPAFAPKTSLSSISFVLSLAVFIAAALMLYHILRGIDPDKLIAALKATNPRTLAAGAGFVAAGYLTLTFYDLFALRTIGRADLPYRAAALGGFTSYAVGHNIGASVFSGGAVRYHIYSSWGLSVVDVTKVCFIAGLTFWLGNVAVLGLGVLYAPDAARALDQLPLWANRGIAIFLLALLTAYIVWVSSRPRLIGREKWHLTLPGGSLTLVQIMIGIIDLGCCAAAMYMLMPPQPNLGFVTLAVIFVAATLLGFASHAPGGLGVFDTAMLIALWQFNKEELVAGLLLFRLLYYIVPFVLSLFILGIREALVGRAGRSAAVPAPAPAAIAEAGEYMRRQSDAT
jgi:glycosyltransferase 2 family protein